MPLGIVSDEEFKSALKEPQSRPSIVPIDRPGRDKGDNNVPPALRNIIGETSLVEGRGEALDLAARFGVSPSSVSAYNSGKTSTASPTKNQEITNHLNKVKERISRKARRVMIRAIDTIDDEKLNRCDAPELATVARTMSAIFKDMEPDTDDENNKGNGSGPTFVFMVPQMVKEEKYPVITVKD